MSLPVHGYSQIVEARTWESIKDDSEEKLARFPTSLQQDREMLQRDEHEHFLGKNKRNCVLYRKNQKVVLHFLIDCANKV